MADLLNPLSKPVSRGTKVVKMDGEDYEVIPGVAVSSTKMLMDAYERLGSPKDPFSQSGEKVMNIIISLWQDLYPKESKEWFAMRAEYKKEEMSAREQVHKQTGRSLASVPPFIYDLMKKLLPEFKGSNREEWMKLVKRYPIFRMANQL